MITSDLLRGRTVRLTALGVEDLGRIARWQEDAEYLRLFDARPACPKTEAQLRKWLEDVVDDPAAFLFGIRLAESDELVGYVELDGILWPHGTGWLGIGIGDRAYWSQGYGSEAAKLALRFAFNELNLHRMQATIFSYNQRSQRLFERLGFRREGVFREFILRDGQRFDMILYGLLRTEWITTLVEEGAGQA